MSVEVRLPGVVLDSVAATATAGVVLANRFPAPDAVDVAPGTAVEFDILGLDGQPINTALTQVYINGTLAWSAGTWQTGFTGTSTTPPTNVERMSIQSDSPYTSESVVTVRVIAQDAGLTDLDESYTFTIADVAAPQVVSAVAWGPDKVRVTFSEAVAAASLAASGFTFAAQTAPAVPITGTEVAAPTTTVVEITTSPYMSPGQTYRVTVAGVLDLAGNAVDPAAATADFTGFVFPAPLRRSWQLWDFIPGINKRSDTSGDLRNFITCLQDVLDVILYQADRWTDIVDPTRAQEAYLDRRLLDLGNPFHFEMTAQAKARLALILVRLYLLQGTAPGIEGTVEFFFPLANATVIPKNVDGWILGTSLLGTTTVLWPGGSGLYDFDLQVDNGGVALTTAEVAQVRTIVNYTKSAPSHYIDLIEV